MTPKPDERGVALLTTLLLVAAMAAIAVAVLDDIRFAIRRASNMESLSQAQWYALGAETLARSRLETVLARRSGYVTLEGGWSGFPVVYPIDNGAIRLRLIDRGGCFNLNSVVSGEPDHFVRNATGAAQFRSLLAAQGIPDGDGARLADALVDWIDTDAAPQPLGAEDETYLRRRPAYRTSGQLLAEETELRAVQGVTPEIYQRIRPLVCALPNAQLTGLNINTLVAGDAPVLSAIYLGRLPVETARQIIAHRPAGGWNTQADFLKEPLLEVTAKAGGAPPIQQLEVRTRFFTLSGTVEFARAVLPYSAVFEASPSGALLTAARRWTPAE